MHGHKRAMGPSSVTIGDGVAYVGTRSTNEVCAIDEKSLKLGKCVKLATPPDFVTYVAPAKEVWVTTPKDQSLTVLDATKPASLKSKLVIKASGSVEGAAVDADHGLYYTNLEDKNRTLAVDIQSHAIQTTWDPGCGEDGPRGIAVDPARSFLFVACSDGVRVLDAAHGGAKLGKLDAGAGVDDIVYDASRQNPLRRRSQSPSAHAGALRRQGSADRDRDRLHRGARTQRSGRRRWQRLRCRRRECEAPHLRGSEVITIGAYGATPFAPGT